MKKLALIITLLFPMYLVKAQSSEDIRKMINDKKFTEARTAIDKFMGDSKNAQSAEGWYLKGRIYNSISNDEATPVAERYQLKTDAYEALKKSQELDPKETMMKLEQYISYLDLYFGFYDLGAKEFNDKEYVKSFEAFKKALEVEDFIRTKGYTYTQMKIPAVDTSLIVNTAIAASQAKYTSEAVNYYRKIADANIAGKDYKDVYEFLVDYYNRNNDAANLYPLLSKARTFYPENNFWNEVELDRLQKAGDDKALFAKYDELVAKEPNNFNLVYNYSVELYNRVWGKTNDKPADEAEKEKLATVLKQAIAIDPGIDASMLMTNHLYNEASDLTNAAAIIKSTKAADVKQKADLKAAGIKKMDETITYATRVESYYEPKVDELKPGQKANYKIVLGYLADIYSLKGDAKKSAEYEKKRSAVK